jgi:hypothetical protein
MPLVDFNIAPVNFSPLANIGLAYADSIKQKEQQAQQQQTVAKAQEIMKSGDFNQMADFALANPELGKTMFELGGIRDEAAQKRMTELSKGLTMSQSPVEDLTAYIQSGEQQGRDMSHSKGLLDKSQGNPEALKQMAETSWASADPKTYKSYRTTLPQAQDQAAAPSDVRETEWFINQTPEVQAQHLKLKRKTDPTMAEKLEFEQSKSGIKVGEAGLKKGAEGTATRQQGFVDSGVDAADSLGNAYKVKELLDSVETGGFDNAALMAKRLFGVESADEAQLSANLGKAILSQLKPIFGAAFTAAEGDRLEKIEANFGKSTEGNKRLISEVIKTTEKAARRGVRAAEAQGDKFAADEIRAALDALKSGGDAINKPSQKDQQYPEGTEIQNPSTGQKMIMRNGGWVDA